jgi:hypothetical protein
MNSRNTRIIKEARGLFWPWCVVMVAAALPALFRNQHFLTFFAGIPLLASLSMGNEFRHGTLSLLLSQPVDRMKIWREKLTVTIIATLSVTLVFALVFRFGSESFASRHPWFGIVTAGQWFIVAVGSATFWTLFSRSTLGGFVLNFIQSFLIVPFGSFVIGTLFLYNRGSRTWNFSDIEQFSIYTLVVLSYTGVMLWLGRRKLSQFQVTGGIAGDDLLMAGPSTMPEAVAGLFRSSPAGATLNVIRKEIRLLRPLWLLTLLGIACLTLMVPVRFMPNGNGKAAWVALADAFITPYLVLTIVIAVSLSLGQERTSGTKSWHMTLPISFRRQWLIKLVTAILTGFICSALIVSAGRLIFGPSFVEWLAEHGGGHEWLVLLAASSLVSFSTFWCACAVNGIVRAALSVFPTVGALILASRFGNSLGGLVAAGGPVDSIATGPAGVVWLVLPTLLLAVIQSYRLFRTEPHGSARSVLRQLMPLAIVAFLCAFSFRVFALG